MSHREIVLYLVNIPFELVLCVLVYGRELHKRLPFFAAYATVLLASTAGIGFIYYHFGFRTATSYYANWFTTLVNVSVRSLAIVELSRHNLRSYSGIWALVWRVLIFLTVLCLGHAAMDAWGQPNWIAAIALTLERDAGISSVVILVAILLMSDYYAVALDPVQKGVAMGILFICLTDVVNNTALRTMFVSFMSSWHAMGTQIERANDWWNTIRTSAFVVSMSIWCFALRKPLPAPNQEPELLPAEIYAEVSPAVNLRLRAINDRLLELLKP